jgi:hypothetical protein
VTVAEVLGVGLTTDGLAVGDGDGDREGDGRGVGLGVAFALELEFAASAGVAAGNAPRALKGLVRPIGFGRVADEFFEELD